MFCSLDVLSTGIAGVCSCETPSVFIAKVWNRDVTKMFWRLEKSSWLPEEWSFLWADSVLSMEEDARIFLLSLKGIAILLCPKLKNLPHESIVLAWTNKILNKTGTEETTFIRLPSSEPACPGSVLSLPLAVLTIFALLQNQWGAKLVQKE